MPSKWQSKRRCSRIPRRVQAGQSDSPTRFPKAAIPAHDAYIGCQGGERPRIQPQCSKEYAMLEGGGIEGLFGEEK